MNTPQWIMSLSVLTLLATGCGKGWQMDYGKPAAQFLQEDVVAKGKPFVGKKVTIKGTVTKVDTSDPDSVRIHLAEGIECDLGSFKAMAESCKAGDTVFVDGFLERCNEGEVLLEPAMLRDPTAPFAPR